ncbi:MAG: hypothetical protein GY759_18150 [Chloroflexi bacterium]|nr:hypothetical protein [Chloroflexota bacterium]
MVGATNRSEASSTPNLVSVLPAAFLTLAVLLWYVRPVLGPWPLTLVAAAVAIRVLTTGSFFTLTPFDPPLLLFLATAALGAAISYNAAIAWPKFWAIVSALVLFRAVVDVPERIEIGGRSLSPLWLIFALLPSVIALHFLFTSDWSQMMGSKMAVLDPLRRWLAILHVDLPGHLMHPNVVGGFIAALLPLQIAAFLSMSAKHWRWVAIPMVALSLAGLVMSTSRGAWIALAAVTGLCLLWRWDRRLLRPRGRNYRLIAWGGMAVLILLASGLAITLMPCDLDCQSAIDGRLGLWRLSLDLALDTPFTGIGFGGYEMAFSSYVMLLHVGYLQHAHDMYLQVWLEQGLLGLVALAWMAVIALRLARPLTRWRVAALASFGIMLIHGIVDIPFYGGRGVLLLFVPMAVMAREFEPLAEAHIAPRDLALVVVTGTLLLLAVLAVLPGGKAMWQTNLGALAQTQTELATYRWPQWPIQDALRRSGEIDLSPAIARYEYALALDPSNAVAHRRLGQIQLSMGQYDNACLHLQAAYATAPDHIANRLLLGECYAIKGEIEQAAALWGWESGNLGRESHWTKQPSFSNRAWWYDHIGEAEAAAGIVQAVEVVGGS